MNILFASSEAHPLIKTGGLADVSGSLPRVLKNSKQEIRLILPAYPQAVANAGPLHCVAELDLPVSRTPVRLLRGRLPNSRVCLYLVDAPYYFDRPGGPYGDPDGKDWPDNAARFALFSQAVCRIALDRSGLDWRPDLVHCNDWQTGLIPALLARESERPATLFTIHNLAYQGLFDAKQVQSLGLPDEWWSMHQLEFHGRISYLKGGLVFADWLNTVSPTYAGEILTPEFGCGLEGLLEQRKAQLSGILNGVDYRDWSPGRDRLIPYTYTARTLRLKQENKIALQNAFGLPARPDIPLLGHVGRLVEQKGLDLILELIPELLQRPMQLVILGTGQAKLEKALLEAQRRHHSKIGVRIAYDEKLAHLLEAGSDAFLMPSRFEPCGLNQLYSLRYGTPPIVRRTGGLADSVVDASGPNLFDQTATGFVFEDAEPAQLLRAIDRTLNLYAQQRVWTDIVQTGMHQDFSWERSAETYLELYRHLLSLRQQAARPQLAAARHRHDLSA